MTIKNSSFPHYPKQTDHPSTNAKVLMRKKKSFNKHKWIDTNGLSFSMEITPKRRRTENFGINLE